MEDIGWTPSPSVLSIKASMLKKTRRKETSASSLSAGIAANASDLEALQHLYSENDGDLIKIFECLGEAPERAIKYPP